MMSKSIDDDNIPILCANCGKGEECAGDLKACTACKMVKYCNRDCQVAHRPQHKKACRKRAAELHDEKLFKQPPPAEDCDICMLHLPSLDTAIKYKSCCGKMICSGCIHAVAIRDGVGLCPFCRTPMPTSNEIIEQMNKRIELEDAGAMYEKGCCYHDAAYGLPRDYNKALEQWHKLAAFGYAPSYYNIGGAYHAGNGVEIDKKKAVHYFELAAIGGVVIARYNLGVTEYHAGNMDRAVKHYMIAVGSGENNSLEQIKLLFMNGLITKDDYAKALRAYQAYLVEIKSDQRDKAAAADDRFKYY